MVEVEGNSVAGGRGWYGYGIMGLAIFLIQESGFEKCFYGYRIWDVDGYEITNFLITGIGNRDFKEKTRYFIDHITWRKKCLYFVTQISQKLFDM